MLKTFKNSKINLHFLVGRYKLGIMNLPRRRRGMYLPAILMASVIFIAFATAIITLSLSNVKMANLHNRKITSMSIAEAGINYYLWHLSHDNEDYCDGQSCVGSVEYGPYTHNYTDQSGNSLGTYELYITPPTVGDSTVRVKSIGKVNGSSPRRTVIAELGMPSFSKYTLLVNNSELWVGSGETIDGSVFINHSGVKNDGVISHDTSSTEETYHSDMFGTDLAGINGNGTFSGAKLFPVPVIDFNKLDVDIRTIRDEAKDDGEGDYYDSSGSKGYHLILGANQYELRRVTRSSTSEYTITKETNIGSYDYPPEGIIFLEDHVWVEGTINGKQITILAADPEANQSQRKRIVISNNLKYTSYDGTDKIGLITQTDILLPRNAPSTLEIDAAMIAKNGQIKINSYCTPSQTCNNDHKTRIKVYGSMAHNTGLAWTYDYGGKWSGYQYTETVIDEHNVLNPPPKFPLTGTYAILSWREE